MEEQTILNQSVDDEISQNALLTEDTEKPIIADTETDSLEEDVVEMDLVVLGEAAKILGLKYHTARDFLSKEPSIRGFDYGFKKVWVKNDILNFKRKHLILK